MNILKKITPASLLCAALLSLPHVAAAEHYGHRDVRDGIKELRQTKVRYEIRNKDRRSQAKKHVRKQQRDLRHARHDFHGHSQHYSHYVVQPSYKRCNYPRQNSWSNWSNWWR